MTNIFSRRVRFPVLGPISADTLMRRVRKDFNKSSILRELLGVFGLCKKVIMNNLHERMHSALDLFLHGCRLWAEVQYNQRFLDEIEGIKAEFQRISAREHNEVTVSLIEKMVLHLLSDLDWAIKDIGLKGLQIEGTRH